MRGAEQQTIHASMISRRGYRLFVNGLALVAFVGIGGMQMYGVKGGVITDYGADLLAPPLLYFAVREGYRIPRGDVSGGWARYPACSSCSAVARSGNSANVSISTALRSPSPQERLIRST